MSIELLTGTGGTNTAADDGTFYRAIGNDIDKILSGCVLSIVDTSKIKITAGHLLVCGRVCKVAEESITVSLASSGTQTKYLWVAVNPDGATPVAFGSGSTYAAGDDINTTTSGIYKALLAVYSATTSAVTAITSMLYYQKYRTSSFNMQNSAGISVAHGTTVNAEFGTFEISGNAKISNYYYSGGKYLGIVVPVGMQSASMQVAVYFPAVAGQAGDRTVTLLRTKASGGGAVTVDYGYEITGTGATSYLKASYHGCALPGDIFTFTMNQSSTQTIIIPIGAATLSATFI